MNTQELVERIKGNPKTTWLAVICGALYAGGDYLHGNQVEPWGALLLGLAGVVGGVGLLLARDGKPSLPAAQERIKEELERVVNQPPEGPPGVS